jgi:hypothetical protein
VPMPVGVALKPATQTDDTTTVRMPAPVPHVPFSVARAAGSLLAQRGSLRLEQIGVKPDGLALGGANLPSRRPTSLVFLDALAQQPRRSADVDRGDTGM